MKTVLLLPIIVFILLGAGCALSAKETRRLEVVNEPIVTTVNPLDDREVDLTLQAEDLLLESMNASLDGLTVAQSTPRVVSLKVDNFSFSPTTITAKPGERLLLNFESVTGQHTFVMESPEVKEEIFSGTSVLLSVPLLPGRYPYYCAEGANRMLGMEGAVIVE